MSDYSDLPEGLKLFPRAAEFILVTGIAVGLFALVFSIWKAALWTLFLGLLYLLMILLPLTACVILFLVLADGQSYGIGKKITAIIIAAVLISAGIVNHTIVRSRMNVFNPEGRFKTERVSKSEKRKVFVPYKHNQIDSLIIKTLNINQKGETINEWMNRQQNLKSASPL